MPVIGIDLGTSYSCVGHFKNNKVTIIENDHGNRTTPSFVAFNDGETLVGDTAQQQAAMNPKNTVYDAKRLIGRNFSDPQVQQDRKHYSFTVMDLQCGELVVEVQHNNRVVRYTPEAISAQVLGYIKQTAERSLGAKVDGAVVTVPAYFNNKQRELTKKAGEMAGLNVLEILNEPSAAALAYSTELPPGEKKILIFDLGGGTFDVSLVSHGKNGLKVLATAGDVHLGGTDFDSKLVEHFVAYFHKTFQQDISQDYRAMRRLRAGCERTKRKLSFQQRVSIEIDCLYQGNDLYTTITRDEFDQMCFSLFNSTLEHVQQVLDDTKLAKTDVDEVLLVGGSTRIPKVRELLENFFGGKPLNHGINADEAVAYGAAIRAAALNNDPSVPVQKHQFQDVCSISLGAEILGGFFSVVIPRNTPLPVKLTSRKQTVYNYQTVMGFPVYEGERPLTKDNRQLGTFEILGLPALPAGEAKADLMFDLDTSGILKITAIDRSNTRNRAKLTIKNIYQNASNGGKFMLLKDVRRFKEQDDREVKRMEAYADLNKLVQSLENAMQKYKGASYFPQLRMLVFETDEWLNVIDKNATHESYVDKREKLQSCAEAYLQGLWSVTDVKGLYNVR